MVIFDSHVHVGWFYHLHHGGWKLLRMMRELHIARFAVSSTTTCTEDYACVVGEMRKLVKHGKKRVVPVLWVTPLMFSSGGIDIMLQSGINWQCVKIHGELHEEACNADSEFMTQTLALAKRLDVPILIHTGEKGHCNVGAYRSLVQSHPEQLFIMAHGRPIDEAEDLLETAQNVIVDTAFMPTSHIATLAQHGYAHRLLWGSNFPINRYFFPKTDYRKYYHKQINDLRSAVNKKAFKAITHDNFIKIFYKILLSGKTFFERKKIKAGFQTRKSAYLLSLSFHT